MSLEQKHAILRWKLVKMVLLVLMMTLRRRFGPNASAFCLE
jgi:hypothetical protein